MIIMPGFVDTHHHQYETILRGILADGVLGSPGDGKKTYQGVIQGVFTPVYQPEDAYISELVASLNQLNAFVLRRLERLPRSHEHSAFSQTRVFHPRDRNPHASSLRKQHRSRRDLAGLATAALNDSEIEPGLLNF
jgi:hypothetical protein